MYGKGKRKTTEIIGLLWNAESNLVTDDAGKAEVVNTFFTSVFPNTGSHHMMSAVGNAAKIGKETSLE